MTTQTSFSIYGACANRINVSAAVISILALSFQLLHWTVLTPSVHAGAFALESTQQQNRDLLLGILNDNQDVRNVILRDTLEETITIREIAEDMQQYWREDVPNQWAENLRVIEEMVSEVVTFAQSGFEGDPAFVPDLTRYIEAREDEVATRFIQSLSDPDAGVVDLPVVEQIQQVLAQVHSNRRSVVSFNDGVVNRANLEAFFQGDRVNTGGWDGFREMVLGEGQTALDAYFRTQMALDDVVRRTTENQLSTLNWSSGFLSSGECEEILGRQICEVTTPGTIIANQVNSALETGFDIAIAAQLEGLDLRSAIGTELDQGVFHGLRYLANDVLNEATGLLSINDFLATFNLDRLLRDLNLENIFGDLADSVLDSLFGDDGDGVAENGQIDPQLVTQVRTNIDNVFAVQDNVLVELGRLSSLVDGLGDAEAQSIYTAVLGPNYEAQITGISENLPRLVTINEQLDNLSAIASATNQTEATVLSGILGELAAVQSQLPTQEVVNAWGAEIDRQIAIRN